MLPSHTTLPDTIVLEPIPLEDLVPIPYRNHENKIVPGRTLDPLDVLEVFQASFTYTEWQIFRAGMMKESAVMVGSSAMASIGVVDVSTPAHLDILVGCNRGRALHTVLRNIGFKSEPEIVKPQYARTVRLVWTYHKPGRKSINIIETKKDSIWSHILTSPSTAHTTFVSATHVFVIDPDYTFSKVALLRNTCFPPWNRDDILWNRLLELGWTVCRNNGSRDCVPNGRCPALRRSLWGGEGIWHSSWSSVLDSGDDYYYQLAAGGFKHHDLWYVWQFAAHCSDWNCDYSWMSNRLSVDGNI